MPDVVVWLVSGKKRLAYQRLPARRLLFAPEPLDRGPDCARLSSVYLKVHSPSEQ